MYYNLKAFGKKTRSIRKNLQLTQKEVSILVGIHVDTLRKIENGKVIPRQDTLDLMSLAYNRDLNNILLKYRLNNYKNYHKLKNKIEYLLESGLYNNLEDELLSLNYYLNKEMNAYFYNLTKQLYLVVESIILKIKDNNYDKALYKLITALKITTPDFSLSSYKSFIYNNMEIRILMNISLILNRIESKNKCLQMLLFCLESLDPEDVQLYIKICYNLSYTYHRLKLHDKALYYSNLGISACNKNRMLNILGPLYFRKGIAEYLLGHNDYMNSLLKAKTLHEISGQTELINMLINSCKNVYDINIK